MRIRVGTKAAEFDAAKEEISANFKNVAERLDKLEIAVNAAVEAAQQNGAQGQDLEAAKLNVQRLIASYRSQPKKNFVSSLDRLTELTEKLALLTTQLSRNYVSVKKESRGSQRRCQGAKGPRTNDQGLINAHCGRRSNRRHACSALRVLPRATRRQAESLTYFRCGRAVISIACRGARRDAG